MWPFLLNIYKSDMIFETPTNIDSAGYPTDSKLYKFSSRIEHVLDNLQGTIEKLFQRSYFIAYYFDFHTNKLLNKATKKYHALAVVYYYMNA